MTKKYHVASSVIASKRDENLSPGTLGFLVERINNEKARKS